MELLVAAVVIASILLVGHGQFGLGACALFVAAFMLWWGGQPGPGLDQDLTWVAEERPRPKNSRRR